MSIAVRKREIRDKIISNQQITKNENVLELLDVYDRYLEVEGTTDELAEAAYLRGEILFRLGRYQDTVRALTKSLSIEKTMDYVYLEVSAYNMLGMLFSFVGYENFALDNYLSAVESAKKYRYMQGEVSALLNIGLLYQGLGDYRKAMNYYKKGHEITTSEHGMPDLWLIMLTLIQQAQILFKMRRYDEVKRIKREIDSYAQVVSNNEFVLSKTILEVWMEAQFGTELRVQQLIEEIRQYLIYDVDYLEQIDFYVDFCDFLLGQGRKADSRQFLDILKEKLEATEFLHLRMRMEKLEVQYQKKYSMEAHYLEACMRYMELESEYEKTIKIFKRQNLNNLQSLQELEEVKQEFEYRSKCDLATGLFNKDAFRFETEHYLETRNRDLTDAMIIIDIDNFKLVNDSYGHLVGDEVIVKLAELMKKYFPDDIRGRFGGDEFVVFVCDITDLEENERKIEQFREAFSGVGFGKNFDVYNTVSIGVSYNVGVNASYKSMLACADEALLKAKEYGKNKVAFYEIKRGLLMYV